MDDRNLVAVAEQAAATSLVKRGPIAGCTMLAEDGRHFRGCRLEFEDPADDTCPVTNALAAARVDGVRRVRRGGYYTPTGGPPPPLPEASLRRLRELATDGFRLIVSTGSGAFVEKSLDALCADAGLA